MKKHLFFSARSISDVFADSSVCLESKEGMCSVALQPWAPAPAKNKHWYLFMSWH